MRANIKPKEYIKNEDLKFLKHPVKNEIYSTKAKEEMEKNEKWIILLLNLLTLSICLFFHEIHLGEKHNVLLEFISEVSIQITFSLLFLLIYTNIKIYMMRWKLIKLNLLEKSEKSFDSEFINKVGLHIFYKSIVMTKSWIFSGYDKYVFLISRSEIRNLKEINVKKGFLNKENYIYNMEIELLTGKKIVITVDNKEQIKEIISKFKNTQRKIEYNEPSLVKLESVF